MVNLKKYKAILSINWQTSLAYRGAFLFFTLLAILPFLLMVFLWLFVYSGNVVSLKGYTINNLVTYYFAVLTVERLTLSYIEWHINWNIREGFISNFIIKPASLFTHYGFKMVAYRILHLIIFVPFFFIFFLIFKSYITFPIGINIFFFLVSVFFSFSIFLCMSFIAGFIAFWYEDADGFLFLKEMIIAFLSGSMLPLDFYGEKIAFFLKFLPFPYLIYYPVSIFMNRLNQSEVIQLFIIQIFWIIVLAVLAKLIYKKGVNKYSAVGG